MGAWVDEDLEVLQNEYFVRTVLFVNQQDGSFFNYTGSTAVLSIRQAWADSSAQLLQIRSDGGSPQIEFLSVANGDTPAPAYPNAYKYWFNPSQLRALAAGTFYYDLLLVWADGTQSYLQRGAFVVVTTAARA